MINKQRQRRKRDLDRDSPILIHRRLRRATIETCQHSSADIDNILGSQLQLTLPPRASTRNRAARASLLPSIPLKYTNSSSKDTIQHVPFDSKLSQSLQISLCTPVLKEKDGISTRILRSKNQPLRPNRNAQQHAQTDRNHLTSRQSHIPDLYITSKSLNKSTSAWEEPTPKIDSPSNEEESLVAVHTISDLTYTPQICIEEYNDVDSSTPLSPKQLLSFNDIFKLKPPKSSVSRRHSYTNALPALAEHIIDE
ncbi:unnamed protein product [Adineta ricciae]|uniref:Uncharacterized protein n=1 Tax=Adineta ricciae TaxID=249248 RepID=A0A813QYM9_ADIRI|nr:unnamed protein product [Adineta ricciae]CAF1212108.1 unnamed protein product [Adineta ricciae]